MNRNMRSRIISFLVPLWLLGGCAAIDTSGVAVDYEKGDLSYDQEKTWQMMIGRWYGNQPVKGGGIRRWITERADEGSYRITFRRYGANGGMDEQTEVGYWGVSGDIYFSIFKGWITDGRLKRSDPRDPYNYDAYRIISLTDDMMEYESASSENRYILQKVAPDFWFPES